MRGPIVFMFSGQGSQYLRMGQALFESQSTFREWMMQLDRLAQGLLGKSITKALYTLEHSAPATFERTLLTHPAIFMVEFSLAQALIGAGVSPDMVCGVSVGSFAAAAVAGCIDVREALSAVIAQAISLERHCAPGTMIAVLGSSRSMTESLLAEQSELAAVNTPSHFVVAAPTATAARIEAQLRRNRITHQRLPVSFAFHSRWIDPARSSFEQSVRSLQLARAQVPLMCCVSASQPSQLRPEYFWEVARRPIKFREAIAQLERTGMKQYIDVGPAGTLATLLKYILPPGSASTVRSLLTPFGRDLQNFAAVTAR
jgi:bacillaene synthase trans-acting acyltransferase